MQQTHSNGLFFRIWYYIWSTVVNLFGGYNNRENHPNDDLVGESNIELSSEQIRQRRLSRFNAPTLQPTTTPTQISTSEDLSLDLEASSKPSLSQSKNTKLTLPAKMNKEETEISKPKIDSKQDLYTSTKQTKKQVTQEQLISNFIQSSLNVTLKSTGSGHNINSLFLENKSSNNNVDKLSQNERCITESDIALILNYLSETLTPSQYIDYLLRCYSNQMTHNLQYTNIVSSIKRNVEMQLYLALSQDSSLVPLIFQNCSLSSQSVYSDEVLSHQEYQELLGGIVLLLNSEEDIIIMFGNYISQLVHQLNIDSGIIPQNKSSQTTSNSSFGPLSVLFGVPRILNAMAKHPQWSIAQKNIQMPHQTILGAILYCAPPASVIVDHFPRTQLSINEVTTMKNRYQDMAVRFNGIQSICLSLIRPFFQAKSPSLRKHFFSFLNESIVNGPLKPNLMHYQLQKPTNTLYQLSDPFFSNLCQCMVTHGMLQLTNYKSLDNRTLSFIFDPNWIHSASSSSGAKIFPTNTELLFSDSTIPKLPYTAPTESIMGLPSVEDLNEWFWSTHYILNLGYTPILEYVKQLLKQREKADPVVLNLIFSKVYYIYSMLFGYDFVSQIIRFYDLTSRWLLSCGLSDLSNQISDEEREENPNFTKLSCTPQYVINNMVQFISFIDQSRHTHSAFGPLIVGVPLPCSILSAIVSVAQCPMFRNPHLTANMIEAIRGCVAPNGNHGERLLMKIEPSFIVDFGVPFHDHLSSSSENIRETNSSSYHFYPDKMIKQFFKYYSVVERTGQAHQFYEKFPVRLNLSVLIRTLSQDLSYKKYFMKAIGSLDVFVPFASSLLADTLYLVDEVLSQSKIWKQKNQKLNDPTTTVEEWNQLNSDMAEIERMLQSLSLLGTESTLLLENVSSLILQHVHSLSLNPLETSNLDINDIGIVHGEVLEPLATVLNYFSSYFANSTKLQEICMDQAKNFNVPSIMSSLVICYINIEKVFEILGALKKDEQITDMFGVAILSDTRSFSIPLFKKTAEYISTHSIVYDSLTVGTLCQITQLPEGTDIPAGLENKTKCEFLFEKFITHLERVVNISSQNSVPLDEVPDEYLDSVSAQLLRDPVKLPSGNYIDKVTFARLMADPQPVDPFTRAPLTQDLMVIDQNYKAEIQNWIKSKFKTRDE